MRLNTIFLITW